jgi:hypothetical protein
MTSRRMASARNCFGFYVCERPNIENTSTIDKCDINTHFNNETLFSIIVVILRRVLGYSAVGHYHDTT